MPKAGTRSRQSEPDENVRLASVFEERAEYLTRNDLEDWTLLTSKDNETLAKLKSSGAKLLTGPRGSGKSTLLRAAYFDLLDGSAALPVYVNYARSLALEPLFHTNANALQIFRQWVLKKVIVGVGETLSELNYTLTSGLSDLIADAQQYVRNLAFGSVPETSGPMVGPSELVELLEKWAYDHGRKRVVLLLDDAAHAFSPQQQQEFFEIFRELRSSRVAAKAAVYPGITSYSPNLHVGHEAELIEAWHKPDQEDFLPTMRALVEKRLPQSYLRKLEGREDLIDYVALASFGLPRGFLVMLSQILGIEEEDEASKPTKRRADVAIAAHAQSVRDIFQSLHSKMPRYRNFVEVGAELDRAITQAIRIFNQTQLRKTKATVIAIATPVSSELGRVLDMLEYAGIVRSAGTISRGVKGVFRRFDVHYALLIQDNSLSLGRSVAISSVVEALTIKSSHAFVRTRESTLLPDNLSERCTLDLAPCQSCGSPRLSDEAQFCMRCGRPLTDVSIYEELLKTSVEHLPLTHNKHAGLARYSQIKTVGDILLDVENRELRKVPYVGPVWSARIKRYAEEFVSV